MPALTVGTVTTAPSATVPAGSVISQAPVGSAQVTTGSAVALVISSGVPQVATPNVVGLTQAAATTAITDCRVDGRRGHDGVEHDGPRQPDPSSARRQCGTQVLVGSAPSRWVISSGAPAAATLAVDSRLGRWRRDGRDTGLQHDRRLASCLTFAASDGPNDCRRRHCTVYAGLADAAQAREHADSARPKSGPRLAPTPLCRRDRHRRTQASGGIAQSLMTWSSNSSDRGAAAPARPSGRRAPPSGAPNCLLTTTRAGSFVYGVGNDWSTPPSPRTVGANQTMVHQWVNTSVGDTFWVQALVGARGRCGHRRDESTTPAPATDRVEPRHRSRSCRPPRSP